MEIIISPSEMMFVSSSGNLQNHEMKNNIVQNIKNFENVGEAIVEEFFQMSIGKAAIIYNHTNEILEMDANSLKNFDLSYY